MKKEEIKELSIQELRAQIEVAEKAYRELKVAHAITPSDNPAKITADRRDIARLKTVLRQKEIAAQEEANKPEASGPTQMDRIEAQALYTAMMTNTLLEEA